MSQNFDIPGREPCCPSSDEHAVRLTNNDALMCKQAAVKKRYWPDQYLKYFTSGTMPTSKPPEISRGYYARVCAVFQLVEKFLKLTGSACQIVNLGAGFDTLFWRLYDDGLQAESFIELDFADVVAQKTRLIKRAEQHFASALDGSVHFSVAPTELHSDNYHLIGTDLRSVECLKRGLQKCNVSFEKPTLFVCECVLVYLPMEKCQDLLKFLAETFSCAFYVGYEMINLNDAFGQVFKQNMLERSILLGGGEACASAICQQERFLCTGWQHARVWPMTVVYKRYLPEKDVQRVERLESLDEPELLTQLLDHYCMIVASNNADSTLFNNLGFS